MAEPGFAWALYYQVTRQPAAAKQAIDWALKDVAEPDASVLRQLALVFDWCGPAMTPAQSDRLAAKIQTALAPKPAIRRPRPKRPRICRHRPGRPPAGSRQRRS